MENIIKSYLLIIPLLHSATYAMNPNTTDLIIKLNQFSEKEQKQQILDDKETKIAAAKYYMLTEQLIPFYLIGKLDNETSRSA